MKIFGIREPVFKTATVFVLDCSFKDFERLMKRRYKVSVGEWVGQCGQMFTFKSEAPWRCVWTEAMSLPVVLHEVFHLVTRICDDKGVPIKAHIESGESCDETAAYLFEFFARELLEKRPLKWRAKTRLSEGLR